MVKETYPIKELTSRGGDRNYVAPKNNKPYFKFVREDMKIVRQKAKEEVNKAYTKGFTPDYIMDNKAKQPKFEMEHGMLVFKEDR